MPASRAEVNRANAQKSTGPKTPEGKARSSANSFKHGLYARDVIMQGEDPGRLENLRADLRREHQPVNTTEEILVDELAQHYWRLCRLRRFEVQAWTMHESEKEKGLFHLDIQRLQQFMNCGMLEQFQRMLTSAERSFHKALATLRQLQRDRGFVPSKQAEPAEPAVIPAEAAADPEPAPLESTPKLEIERDNLPALGFVPPFDGALSFTPEDVVPKGLLADLWKRTVTAPRSTLRRSKNSVPDANED